MISITEIEKAYSDYSKEIFSYILRSVRDHEASEDILQDVFIKLLNYSLKSTVHAGNIRALLYSIARSVCIDSARKSSREKIESVDISVLPDHRIKKDGNSIEELMDAMNLLIDTLSEPEKSIILFKRNGLTYTEISDIMKISERTLKRKIKSVIEYMRKKLKEEGFSVFDDTGGGDGSFN
jgi:RNA polymerase sigma factor (sigma-70 family)